MAIAQAGPDDKISVFPLSENVAVDKDIYVTMPDGVRIALNVYRPAGATELLPVVLAFTQYAKDNPASTWTVEASRARQAVGLGLGEFTVSEVTSFEAPDPAYWTAHGYAVVYVDARGTGKSEGVAADLCEWVVDDFGRIIEWAADQPWSNGKVGLTGVSYLAIAQFYVAAKNPRGLAAIIPWEGSSDYYRDDMYHGGIPETGFIPWLTSGPIVSGSGSGVPGSDEPAETVSENSPLEHEMYTIWGDIARPVDTAAITVPMLVCGSWSDQGLHSRGSFNVYQEASSAEKYLYTHGRGVWTVYYGAESLAWQKAFFDRHLKGIPEALAGYPPVRLEVRLRGTEHEVRAENCWPPSSTVYTRYHLDATNLSLSAEPVAEGSASYRSTESVPVSFSLPFAEDTEITGPASLTLWVSTDAGEDIDLFVGLRKFDMNGGEVHFEARENDPRGIVSNGWLRVSHRKLDPQRSTPERPYHSHDELLAVVPGEIYRVEVEILPSSTLFEAGTRLQLSISGRDIWSNRLCQHRELRNHGNHTVHTGALRPSSLLLPVITR